MWCSVATFHHIADPGDVRVTLAEMVRVARPGGRILVWDHNPRNPYWGRLMARVPQDTGEERLIGEHEVEGAVLERQRGARPLHRLDVRRPRAQDLQHPLGRVDPGHGVAGGRQARCEHAGPAADVERPPAATARDRVAHPLAQVVLDDVRGQRLVVAPGDRVKV